MKMTTVAEIQDQYPDEWVLMAIASDNKDDRKVAGHLLAHGPDRTALNEAYWQFRALNPSGRVYQFFTGALVAEDADVVIVL